MNAKFPELPPDALNWQDGMLLTAGNFRDLDGRIQQMIAYATYSAAPYFWGVRQLEIEKEQLAQGIVSVRRLDAMLPNGLAFSFKGSAGQVLAVTPKKQSLGTGSSLIVFVSERAEDQLRQPSATEGWADESDSAEIPEPDDVRERLPPNLLLSVASSCPDTGLPLARLVDRGGGLFGVDDTYIPPTSFTPAESVLGSACREHSVQLRRMANDSLVRAGQADPDGSLRFKAFSLTAGLFQLEAVLNAGVAHPFQLYLALCHATGHIAGATLRSALPVLEPYNHFDIRASFDQVLDLLKTALGTWPEGYERHPFRWDETERTFSLDLDPSWLPTVEEPNWPRLTISGQAAPNATTEKLRSWMESAVIALQPKMKAARDRKVRGARRSLVDAIERVDFAQGERSVLIRVPAPPNDEFLRLQPVVTTVEVLQVINPDEQAARPIGLALYVQKRPAATSTAAAPSIPLAAPVAAPAAPVAPRAKPTSSAPVQTPDAELDDLYRKIGQIVVENGLLRRKPGTEGD